MAIKGGLGASEGKRGGGRFPLPRRTVWTAAVQAWLVVFIALLGYGEGWAQLTPVPTEEAKLRVARFRVTGSTVFPPQALRALLAEGEGRELTLTEIEALAERITAHYRKRGYILARAYVPAQDIREGIVEIAILEGRIGRINIEGAKWYSPDLLRPYVDPGKETPVFHEGRHERGMLLLNDLPGLEVKSILTPGAEVGTTDIILSVEKDRQITGSLDTNNYGSRFSGRERLGTSVDLNNLFGFGDVFSVRGQVSRQAEDFWLIRSSYTAPLSSWGTKVGAAFTLVQTQVGDEFRELEVMGTGRVISVYATHPFIRSRTLNFYAQGGFDHKNFENYILQERANRDRLRVMTFGLTLDAIDRWRGLTSVNYTLHQGIPDFIGGLRLDDDVNASREGAGGRFTKLTTEISRLQQITGTTSFFLRGTGQWASTLLVSPEQFSVGGMGTVRGYPLAEFSGDEGYAINAEIRWNAPGFSQAPAFKGKKWGDILQFFVFTDHGSTTVIDPIPGQDRTLDVTSAGFGLRFGIPNDFHIRLEYAHPVDGPEPTDHLIDAIYFQLVKWF